MNPPRLAEIPVVFYRTSGGAEPVLEWLRSLPTNDRRAIGIDLATVQFGWPVGMPLCRPFGDGLWEVRSNLARGRIARILFCTSGGRMVLLHAFIKKTQRTPNADMTSRKLRPLARTWISTSPGAGACRAVARSRRLSSMPGVGISRR